MVIKDSPEESSRYYVPVNYIGRTTLLRQFEDGDRDVVVPRYASWEKKGPEEVGSIQERRFLGGRRELSCSMKTSQGISGPKKLLVKRQGGYYCRGPRRTDSTSLRQKNLQWKQATAVVKSTPVRGKSKQQLKTKAEGNFKVSRGITRKTREQTFGEFLANE
jgi:hypothetical protein